jgi:hypothetical protein
MSESRAEHETRRGKENRRLLGKLLGEIYRLQRANDVPCPASKMQVYGLLHGFDDAIEEQLEIVGSVTAGQVAAVAQILDSYYREPEKLKNFKGFYDIEAQLQEAGVDRTGAMQILRYFKAGDRFAEVIAKMDSDGSPTECRTSELWETDV